MSEHEERNEKMEYNADLKITQEAIEIALKEYMKFEDMPQKRIFEAMEYSLLAGGKRLRPVIMIYATQLCGGNMKEIMPFACAIEMIHTYSLIHDDLPAMDNDDLRRGKPTNHIIFDEATAILAGDGLLNMAFEIASNCNEVSPRLVIRALKVLSKASGVLGMIGGQVIDIESENKKLTLDELKNIHALKTGALIRAAGVCGAILGGGREEEIRAVDEFCSNLGIAFQIRDDVLDVEGDEKTLGKPIGSDAENNKNTYVTLTSLEEAEDMVLEYTKRATDAISIFGEKAQKLSWLANMLTQRKF